MLENEEDKGNAGSVKVRHNQGKRRSPSPFFETITLQVDITEKIYIKSLDISTVRCVIC